MSATTPIMSIYELTFAQSDETDAVLKVNGKYLHVNRALLSYHSTYFNNLFKAENKENIQYEYEIEDVHFEDFATLLSTVQKDPISLEEQRIENLLVLADKFKMPAASRHVELVIASSLCPCAMLYLADKYNLGYLLQRALACLDNVRDYRGMYEFTKDFNDKTKLYIFTHFFKTFGGELGTEEGKDCEDGKDSEDGRDSEDGHDSEDEQDSADGQDMEDGEDFEDSE